MTEAPVSKYLQVFPNATREHARSVMEVERTPTRNTQKSVYLTLDELPSLVYPGHPGHHWLSIAVESEVRTTATVALSPLWGVSSVGEPPLVPLVWSCVFEVGDNDPDRLQEKADDLLARYLRAGFKMSPSLAYHPVDLVTDHNMLALALSDEHLELMGQEKGATPLLTGKCAEVFEVGNLQVGVKNTQGVGQRPRGGWREMLRSLVSPGRNA